MGHSEYKVEISPGIFKSFYEVRAEAINKFSLTRIQRKRRGVNKLAIQKTYIDLLYECRNCNPVLPNVKFWKDLVIYYDSELTKNKRSADYPEGISPTTILNKNASFKHVEASWGNMALASFTALIVKSKIDSLVKDGVISPSMAYDLQKNVKAIFSFAHEAGALASNPLAPLKNRKRIKRKKKALTHPEVEKLLAEANLQDHPFFPIWLFAVTLGLRRSELAGLKWTDIDFDNRLVHLSRQKIPKEGIVNRLKDKEDRIVAIPLLVMPHLKMFKLRARTEFVIEIDNNSWEKGHQAAVLREFCRKIGISEIRHHQLRTTYVSLSLADGVTLGNLMENVGHANIATTNEYLASSGANIKGSTDILKIKVPPIHEAQVLPLERAAK